MEHIIEILLLEESKRLHNKDIMEGLHNPHEVRTREELETLCKGYEAQALMRLTTLN